MIEQSARAGNDEVDSTSQRPLLRRMIHTTEGFFTFGMAFVLLMVEASLLSYVLRWWRDKRTPA